MRVVVAGGGTAGHVYPGVALARALRDRGHDVVFVGSERGLEAKVLPAAGFEMHLVPARPLARKLSPAALAAPVAALKAMARCRPLVRQAGGVVGMGGYVSVPAVLAGWREGVPVTLHEQNAIPGLANRTLSRASRAVALSFAEAAPWFRRRRTEVTGNPVRDEILGVRKERNRLRKEALGELGLEDGRRTVVLFGGSQGALHLDRAAVGACRLMRDRDDLQMVLITGSAHLDAVERALGPEEGALVVRPVGYLDRMDLAYAAADLVVARAGATTIAEVTVCGLPALLIPYPYATHGHQEANARALQRSGGASVMLDREVTADSLAERIASLIDHPERLEAMAERSRAFGKPDATDRLADLVEEVAGGR